ncbi:MAG TPA: hypothetical protein PK781_03325 [Terrimesophilobacter sp.]|nr:hypothetical protein [Terrimesophilobacter sp.]HRP99473.1 hypothetical protein [Terrimesophilobacter sp.]
MKIHEAAADVMLAIGADDHKKVIETLKAVAAEPAGTYMLIVTLASIGIGFAQQLAGEDWRDQLNYTLLDMSTANTPIPDLGERDDDATAE